MENNKIETTEELLKKIQKLEEAHANLKQHMISNRPKYMSVSTLKMVDSWLRKSGGIFSLTESQCQNILQSMGQSVYMFDLQGRIVYWNRMSEILYGYTIAEALGKTAPDIIIEAKYAELATVIILRAGKGESWFGEFPVRNKNGKRFSVITTLTPSRDEYGTSNGVLCLCANARPFKESRQLATLSSPWRNSSTKFGHDPQQSLQTAITSKISNLASKIKLRMNCNMDYDGSDSDNYYSHLSPHDLREDASSMWEYFTTKHTPDSSEGSENRRGIHKRDPVTQEPASPILEYARLQSRNGQFMQQQTVDNYACMTQMKEAQAGVPNSMADEEIVEAVLGSRRCWQRGIGHKLSQSSGFTSSSSSQTIQRMYTQDEVERMMSQMQAKMMATMRSHTAPLSKALSKQCLLPDNDDENDGEKGEDDNEGGSD